MTTPISRHPDDATLMAYAAGSQNEALSAAIAAHVSMCPRCRQEVADMEAIGDVLLGRLAPSDDELQHPSRIPPVPECARVGDRTTSGGDKLPAPLSRRYGLSFDAIPWRILTPGVWHHRLQLSSGEGDLRLLRIARGLQVPEHGHGGTELTLVLDGAYSDSTGRYCRGDIQDVDEDVEHRPMADPTTGCVCLIASEQRARFKGLLGRFISPLTGL